jgi:hypothetical protein
MKLAEHNAMTKKKRNPYRLLVGKSEGQRPLETPWPRRDDNIKMGL